jgi:hypothetical protein
MGFSNLTTNSSEKLEGLDIHFKQKLLISISYFCYCHNPTNNPKQFKTTFVGVVLLLVGKKTTTI